jgi:quercetin dioxygenase-like cupin family protein
LEPFAVPTVSGYSVASMHPGQNVPIHEHESMHEFFYILEGTGIFLIPGTKEELRVSPGTFLHFSPHESHGILVPEDSPDGDLKMLISGVVIEK